VLSPGKEDEELNKPLSRSNREEESAVGFREAWRIPGVAPFAFCLFWWLTHFSIVAAVLH